MQTIASVLLCLLAAAETPVVTLGEGRSAEPSTDGGAAASMGRAAEAQAVDRAVAHAVHSFLEGYLGPQAMSEAGSQLRARVESRPEAFVPEVKVVALREEEGQARAEVQARISIGALRGVLQEFVAPRTILMAVAESAGDRRDDAAPRLTAEIQALTHEVRIIDPGELEALYAKQPALRSALGGQSGAAELGLRVLAELVCVGTIRVSAEESHLKNVFVGTAEAQLRLISCSTSEVIAALSVDFQDEIPARRQEAERRARDAIYRKAADALVKAVAARRRADVRVSCDLGPIYAALVRGYPTQPFGYIAIRNTGKESAGPFLVTVALDDALLIEPFQAEVGLLAPGAESAIPVRGPLAGRLLDASSGEISARVAVTGPGGSKVSEVTRAVLVHGANVFNWREPRAIAAYVDPDDGVVKALLASVWRALPEREIPTPELTRAGAIYAALASRGLKYRPDAALPHPAAAGVGIDRVSFPGQTLREGAGDCDDFAVLYAAALEAAGIPAGIIVSKDHVLVAVETGLVPLELAGAVLGEGRIVARGGKAWLPIEATGIARGTPFVAAWDEARLASALLGRGEAELVEVREAWKTWPPMTRQRGGVEVDAGSIGAHVARETRALGDLVRERLGAKAAVIERTPEGTRLLGRLFAVCGMIDAAREAFGRALGAADGFAVRFNLGETLLLGRADERDPRAALSELERAFALVPEGDGPARVDTLLRIALAHRLIGDPDAERKALAQACAIDAGAERSYLALFETSGKAAAESAAVRKFLLEGLK